MDPETEDSGHATSQKIVPTSNAESEEITVELESDGLQSVQLAGRSLVGKVLVEKPLNKGEVKNILLKAWRLTSEVHIADMGTNLFLFTFSQKKEAKEILDKGPWFVMGRILSLQFWAPQISAYELNFDRIPFWVQLHGLPLEMMNTSNAAKLMGRVGEVIEVENPFVGIKLIRTFIRVKALIDIKKPIISGCWVPCKGMPKTWIPLRYEKLQALCFNYGILGHEQRDCKVDKVMESANPSIPKHGPKLGVPLTRPIISILKEQGFWSKGSSSTMEENSEMQQKEGEKATMQERDETSNSTDKSDKNIRVAEQDQFVSDENNQQNVSTNQGIGAPPQPVFSDLGGVSDSTTLPPQGNIISNSTPKVYLVNQTLPPKPSENPNPIGEKPISVTDPSPTLVDLHSGLPQPGLGPINLQELGIQTEFIGLKDPVIVLDYPSPEDHRYKGIKLTVEEINKCKKKCVIQEPDLGYTVEFPPEDTNEALSPEHGKDERNALNKEEEKRLIVGWNQALTLRKRNYEEHNPKTNPLSTTHRKFKQRKGMSGDFPIFAPQHYAAIITEQRVLLTKTTLKAEEAGQTMPPPQP
ncbi:Zinc knuckle CX2CX4HX4C [Sesbania bispinosa]|nr:Zinc knuckle CX2CX4HX4C [Sesbania bispinosa]